MGEFNEYSGRGLRSADGIANRIILTRQYPGKQLLSFLIVEGEKDKKVYEWFTDKSACQVSVAHGKETAIDVLSILEKEHVPGVLAIVDVDFDALEGRRYPSPNLLFRKVLGTHNANDVKPELVEKPLRLAFERSHFERTELYAAIKRWEAANTPFVVLHNDPNRGCLQTHPSTVCFS